jgi:hypothetical protein
MKGKHYLVSLLALGLLLAVSAGMGFAHDKTPVDQSISPGEVNANVDNAINYQGVLKEDGIPVTGTRDMTFRKYSDNACTTQIGGDITVTGVQVTNGLFSAKVDVNQADFNGQALWVEVEVGGTKLGCQEILPVPYALSLRSGAEIYFSTAMWVGSGSNLKGSMGTSAEWVLGQSMALLPSGRANIGVSGSATSGTLTKGVIGSAENTATGAEAYGVSAFANSSNGEAYGVNAESDGKVGIAVKGVNNANTGTGVAGESTSVGGIGVHANASAVNATTSYGVYASTGNTGHNYGLFTIDNFSSLNIHLTGAIMRVVQNSGTEALETGDVVSFSGIAAPLEAGNPPVILVAKADTANSTAVAGVVYSRYNLEALTVDENGTPPGEDVTPAGAVQPGEYMLIVVEGPAQVKASALAGAIQVGDLLSTANLAGHAARTAQVTINGVTTALPGTVLGKALEPLAEGKKLIYVYVGLK